MASLLTVKLSKGDSPSWGFRLQGGKDFGTPLIIQKVIVGSPAERAGLVAGDSVIRVNASDVFNLRHKDAQDILLRAGNSFDMTIQRGGSTWKPSVVSTGSISTPSPNIHNISPVTRTSLAAKPSENIGAIGTGHNVSAKPFLNGTANGGPKVVNNQYNSPLKLYSEESIAETLSAQTEVLSTGALGVNFKKNEKNYDASKSAVLSLLKEEESNPKSSDHIDHHNASSEIDSTSSPISVACLRHVAAPENKPQPPTPQLPPGQNICADCERLIVGVFVRIKDKNLHVECFKCSTCGTSLKNIGYYNINNKLYCDIHAKLAAKNNPPAPNLVPVTISPGKKAPINAISSALASHPYPSSAPLSPKVNSYQNSLSGSKPFGSVAAPISPSSNYNSLPRTVAPLSPITPISAPSYSPVSSTAHSVTNIVWPPVQEEPELPSACPLFYPPPSNIIIKPRIRQVSENSDNSELDELNSFCSYPYNRMDETTSITGRRSTTECAETITETVERQRLIETIIKDRPEPPTFKLPIFKDSETDKRKNFECTEKISAKKELEEATIIQSKVMESGQQPTYKIRDPVPKKWESQMLQALTISVDSKESEEIIEESLTNIPTKKTTTALGSALAVAPTEPFNPIETSSLEHVPLPEETVPYFPPEDLFSIRLNLEDRVKSNKRKKDANMEKILEDLPKPQEKLNMLAALTTAPERPFTPANFEELIIKESEAEIRKETTTTTIMEQAENKMSKTILDTKKTDNQSDSESSPEILPSFQGFTCSFQNKTDHSKLDIQISTTPPVLDKKHKEKKKSHEKTISEKKLIEEKNTKEKQTKMIQEERTNIIYKKPEQMISLRKPDSLPQYQISVKENAEADIIMMDKIEKSKQIKEEMQQKSEIIRKQDTVTATQFEESSKSIQQLKEMQSLESCSACPLIKVQAANIHRSENTFKPVVDSRPESCTFSPRPLTPSMVNKPPPIIPYYQANLVAQKYGPPIINLLNPKSPGISRSPSPLQQTPKQSQLFSTKSSNIRPKSPAQGPPLNPMQKDFIPNIEDFKRDEAKDSLTVFIPQYKEKIEMKQEIEKQKALNRDQEEIFSSYSDTRQETVTAPQTEYEKSIEKQIISSDNHSTICEIEGEKKKKTNDKQTQAIHSHIYGNIESISKLSENLHSEKSEELKKMKTRSTESSADGSLQIQRTKTVTEEMEHEHKSQEIIMETNITHTGQCFRNVINPEELNQHVVGMHVTSPSHIKSPFLKSAVSAPPKLNTVCQKIGKDIICKSKSDCIECSEKLGPCKPTFNAANIPKPIKVPNLQEETEEIRNPIKPVKHVDSPGSSKPNHKLNPNVPPSDLGAAGGRQTGAIGVAPKRGRGVLNSAQLGGRIPLCGHCHGQIRGPFITALGKIWCPSHFICATPSCKRPLQDLGFVEEQNQLYCEYCFEQYLAPNCTKCGSKIKGDCLRAIGKSFHPECFNCVHCGKLFGNSPFFLEDGSPYCETDWNELFTTKCFACGFPVEAGDRWVEALNNNYHSQCFNCTMCKKNLEGQSFFAKGGRPYCKNHAR